MNSILLYSKQGIFPRVFIQFSLLNLLIVPQKKHSVVLQIIYIINYTPLSLENQMFFGKRQRKTCKKHYEFIHTDAKTKPAKKTKVAGLLFMFFFTGYHKPPAAFLLLIRISPRFFEQIYHRMFLLWCFYIISRIFCSVFLCSRIPAAT